MSRIQSLKSSTNNNDILSKNNLSRGLRPVSVSGRIDINGSNTGVVGPTGSTGNAGENGLRGFLGSTGERGSIGPRGVVGPTGIVGETGSTGCAGSNGDTGPTGSIGFTGADGESCNTGATGSTFTPYKPTEWEKNPVEWLSNFDILNVLKQYEEKYSDFKFIGPTPIDFNSTHAYRCETYILSRIPM